MSHTKPIIPTYNDISENITFGSEISLKDLLFEKEIGLFGNIQILKTIFPAIPAFNVRFLVYCV